MLRLSLPQLEDIISRAVDLGIEKYRASLDPLSDRLNKAEARRYIVRMGYSVAQMKVWEEEGLLHGEKNGDSYNSHVYYSREELKKLVLSIKVKKAILENT